MRKFFVIFTALAAFALFGGGTALATSSPVPGQPSKTCLDPGATVEPGHASTAPGSAFNENGGIAGGVYAGSDGTHSLISGNPKAVSQYDVACFQLSQP